MEIKFKIMWLLSTVLLIFSIIHEGDSIFCYSCSAQRNSSSPCETNVSHVTTSSVNCSSLVANNFTHCVTIITNTSVVRDCANASSCNPLYGHQQCFLCTSGFCNKDFIASAPSSPSIGAPYPAGSQPSYGGSQPGYGGSQPGYGGSQNKPGVVSKPGSGRMNEATMLILVVCLMLSAF